MDAMETPRTPHGDTNPGPEPAIRDALSRAVQQVAALPQGGAVRDVFAEILTRAVASFTETHSVRWPATRTSPDSPQEALAVVAGIEQLRSSLAGMDATWQVTTEQRIRAADAARNVPKKNQGHSTSSELALARRTSPSSSSLSLSSSRRLVAQMPATHQHLSTGRISEKSAQAIARTLDGSSPEVCADVDEWISEHHHRLDGLGTKKTAQLMRELRQRSNPAESRARAERAARSRNVTMHPLDNGMARLTATLRALDAAAVMKTLNIRAEAQRNAGDPRPHHALQADHLVTSILGGPAHQPTGDHDAGGPSACGESLSNPGITAPVGTPGLRLDVGVVITDRALLCGEEDSEMARIEGYGPVPAHILRDTLKGKPPGAIGRWQRTADADPAESDTGDGDDVTGLPDDDDWGDLADLENSTPVEEHTDVEVSAMFRRLYTLPRTGELVAMESTARAFPGGLKRMITWRDETCRTPWCNARIRHLDHVIPFASGGPTSYDNGQGLCARCNYLKEHGLWELSVQQHGTAKESPTSISWHSPHGARGSSPTPHSESPLLPQSSSDPPRSQDPPGQHTEHPPEPDGPER